MNLLFVQTPRIYAPFGANIAKRQAYLMLVVFTFL